jgi:hypothetical protein
MQALKKQLKQNLALIIFGTLFSAYNPAMAKTDFEAQESYLKARVKSLEQNMDHSEHLKHDKSLDFHGVFYGFLPCGNCNGIKTTLSLKQNNNYLIVTQPAKEASREYYEKGKYTWDEENKIVVLTPNKETATRQYRIEDEGTLIQLDTDGSRFTGDEADRYILRRSDTVKSREVHIH